MPGIQKDVQKVLGDLPIVLAVAWKTREPLVVNVSVRRGAVDAKATEDSVRTGLDQRFKLGARNGGRTTGSVGHKLP